MSTKDIIFYKKGGRPKTLSKKEAHESKLASKKEWRKKNKIRVAMYNEMYREQSKKKSKKHSKKHSRKGSRKGSKHSSRHHSRKGSKHGSHKRSKRGSHKRSKHGSRKRSNKKSKQKKGGNNIKVIRQVQPLNNLPTNLQQSPAIEILKVNADGSRILLVK